MGDGPYAGIGWGSGSGCGSPDELDVLDVLDEPDEPDEPDEDDDVVRPLLLLFELPEDDDV